VCSVCDFLLFLGKLVIVLVCGIVSYLSFGGYIPEIKVFIMILLPDLVLEEPEETWGSGLPDPHVWDSDSRIPDALLVRFFFKQSRNIFVYVRLGLRIFLLKA
jgi:hypothetical protein